MSNVTLKLGVNFSLSKINWFVVITLFIMALGRQENCSVAPAVGEPFSKGGRTGARQKRRIFFSLSDLLQQWTQYTNCVG